MTNIEGLVDLARGLKHPDISWFAAAEQAVRDSGITNQADVKRLVRSVMAELSRHSAHKRQAQAARGDSRPV